MNEPLANVMPFSLLLEHMWDGLEGVVADHIRDQLEVRLIEQLQWQLVNQMWTMVEDPLWELTDG